MDCSLPDSSTHGIFQAGVLEWGAIAFSYIVTSSLLMKERNVYFSQSYLNTAGKKINVKKKENVLLQKEMLKTRLGKM